MPFARTQTTAYHLELKVLLQHANAEHHPEVAAFAQKLMLHAQTEEEVSYPTAILIGDYVTLKLGSKEKTICSCWRPPQQVKLLSFARTQTRAYHLELKVLLQHANAEHHPEVAAFAQKLMLHAQTEEEVSYPTAILIGDYVNLKLG